MGANNHQLTRQKYLTDEEIKIMFRVLDGKSKHSLFIQMAFHSGARRAELLAMTRGDLVDRAVHIVSKKGGLNRCIPLPTKLWSQLMTIFGHLQPWERLFNFQKTNVYWIWDKYKPAKKKFHSLRHTFAVRLYKASRDLMLVKASLGHRDVSTTQIYSMYHDTTLDIRKHMRKMEVRK